ncbi:PCNA-associated factor-like [Galleria mellonella]|uniref:PCNA-associated factor n=1 Tax=Galleria mellonella TaxID=7137 RepID=A0A6J1WWB9_GALME|nr:PCNA-associated factor-like [Galleria mellonella]
MARTKASVGAKVAIGKSSKARCSVAPPTNSGGSTGSSERSSRSYSGGNPVCPRETPKWQKPITNFFITKDTNGKVTEQEEDDGVTAGSSKSKTNRQVIESDEEESETVENGSKTSDECPQPERPKNSVLDESIELETLDGGTSHKINEYYPTNGLKGKGRGKKRPNKENIDDSNKKRNSLKRDLEDVATGEDLERVTKKVKIGA